MFHYQRCTIYLFKESIKIPIPVAVVLSTFPRLYHILIQRKINNTAVEVLSTYTMDLAPCIHSSIETKPLSHKSNLYSKGPLLNCSMVVKSYKLTSCERTTILSTVQALLQNLVKHCYLLQPCLN